MKTLMTITLLFVAALSWGQSTLSCSTNASSGAIIDDFTTAQGIALNSYPKPFANQWFPNMMQVGDVHHMMGGERTYQMQITTNAYLLPAMLGVYADPGNAVNPPGGALVLTTGPKEFSGLSVFWGWDLNKGLVPLNATPTGDCDRVRITFNTNVGGLNAIVQLKTQDNTWHMSEAAGVGPGPNNGTQFCVDFPFSTFSYGYASQTVNEIYLGIQGAGQNNGADNWSINNIAFADSNLAITKPCLYVAK